MRLTPLPATARDLAAGSLRTSRRLLELIPRLTALLESAEEALARVDNMVDRIATTDAAARQLIARIDTTHEAARALVGQAHEATQRLTDELDGYLPTITDLRPVLDRLAQTWHPADIDALTETIRHSPTLIRHTTDELLPTVQTLKNVAPDLHELLASSRALNEIVGSVPGLSRIKKRIEDERSTQLDEIRPEQ
jgi:chromosome segregation ATPase